MVCVCESVFVIFPFFIFVLLHLLFSSSARFLNAFFLLLYFPKAQVFIMFTSYIFFSVFFSSLSSHTRNLLRFHLAFLCYFIVDLLYFFTFSSRAACILCIDAVYCYFEALRCCCLCSRLCLYIIFIHRTHTAYTYTTIPYAVHRPIFYIFGCFLVFVLTSQLFKTSRRYITYCAAICEHACTAFGVECGSFQFWLLGEWLSSVFPL